MLKHTIIFLAILLAGVLLAKTQPKINIPLQGNAFVIQNYPNSSVYHLGQLDQNFNWATYHNTPQKFNSFINTLELDQIESTALMAGFDYNLKVTGTLIVWTIGSYDSTVTSNIKLEISYNPESQKTDRRLDFYAYSNAYKSKFIIESVTLTSTTLQGAALYDSVSRIVELNYGIEQTTFLKPVFATIPLLHSNCVDNVSNELIISWTSVDFAEEYELETSFRDNYTDDINTSLPASAINYDFKENSTRIVTRQNYYRIPLVYERGYLLYRIRAVGMGGTDWSKRIPCAWSAQASGNVGVFTNKYGPITPHINDKMNWQLSTNYSDEGKRKDVAQYFDGLFMVRQTITGVNETKNIFTQNILDNSVDRKKSIDLENEQISTEKNEISIETRRTEISSPNNSKSISGAHLPLFFPNGCTFYGSDKIKEIIAQEVIYDFNGRPAVHILPVPTGTHKITYIKKLNKNLSGASYSWKDFDLIDNCLLTVHPLSDDASGSALGAAAYFSPKNPNKLGYNAFIPDSKGYPFSRIQYTSDNTNKIYRQSGVGIVHALDVPNLSGHEIQYYYAKPNQAELDRMFGNEAGYAIRYQKNILVDPNGQTSVSYLNAEGKTIATALTGLKPDNLLALDNESNPEVTIQVDLMAGNIADNIEHSLTTNEQFVVAAETVYNFDYSVQGEKLSYNYCTNNNICLDCIYDLEIKLISNEACTVIPVFSYSGTFGDLVNPLTPSQPNLDLSCAQTLPSPHSISSPFVKTLAAGSYTLIKTLKVNKTAAGLYVKLVFKDTCQSVLSNFLNQEISKIDTTGCYQSCSDCKAANTTTPQNCIELCPEPMNECDRARYMMLADVSPGGQYAQYDITTTNGVTVYDASNYPLSVFNPNNSLPSHIDWRTIAGLHPPGTPVPILDSVIVYWNKSTFPDLFLPYHPERCMLDWCDTKNTGKNYDLKLSITATDSASHASNLVSSTSTDPAYKQLIMNDPFFLSSPGVLNPSGIEFLQFLTNPCGGTGISVLEMAMDAAYCQSQQATQNIINNAQTTSVISPTISNPPMLQCTIPAGYHSSHAFGTDPATKEYEWRMLRDFYRSYKEKYLYESRRNYSIDNGCFNGCIGVQNFWFTPVSLSGFNNSFPNFYGTIPHNGNTWSAEGHIPVNSADMCGNTRALYESKVKRFTNRYDSFSHTTTSNPINLSSINLYDPCATNNNINAIQPQVGAIVSQYVCDTNRIGTSTGKTEPCWLNDFTALLNQNLPLVATKQIVYLQAGQIASSIKNFMHAASTFNLTQMALEYDSINHLYIITVISKTEKCVLKFPARTYSYRLTGPRSPLYTVLIPPTGVCCAYSTNPLEVHFTLKYSDGTSLDVVAATKCPLKLCEKTGTGMKLPHDSCTTSTPFALELFSFLSIMKTPNTPNSGIFHNTGNSHQIDHKMNPNAPVHYSFNPETCKLTLSPATVRTAIEKTSKSEEKISPVRSKIPAPCTITFADCNWIKSNSTLISIKPYFSNGFANSVTNEFIITYCQGSKPDTFTVRGNSGCFSINDCDPPYFCSEDSIPKIPVNNFNSCVQSKILTATFIAYSNYGKWLDSLKNDLLEKYYAKCMKAKERINYNYPDRQFHYTLYYYDQAGNLVRTVPPAGVNLLGTNTIDAIDSARVHYNQVPYPPVFPVHNLVTHYGFNSLNQNRWQITPDGGRSDFWYDKLGRIAASQNAKQLPNNDYGYSWYDKLGRTVETGKITLNGTINASIVSDYDSWNSYLYSLPNRSEITYTKYDEFFSSTITSKFGSAGQQNLRGRVASTMTFADNATQIAGTYRHATHYSYDVSVNLSIVLQDYPLTPLGTRAIAYSFDYLTGKVNEIRYQPGKQDEFRHKYIYDNDLRIKEVLTSRYGLFWERDAEYFYYKHGPAARMELGQLKVQGLDYIYTLEGEIKSVNGTTQDRTQDAGRDGIAFEQPTTVSVNINGQPVLVNLESNPGTNSNGPGYHSLHNAVAADAFGYCLGYYEGDYSPISGSLNTTSSFDAGSIGDVKQLYNGNISRMYIWLQGLNMGGLGMNYRYDQLNRLKIQQAFTISAAGVQTLLSSNAYEMKLSYDPNGNITKLDRNGRVTNADMDKLTYNYYPGTNQLAYVQDAINSNYPETGTIINGTVKDIDGQNPGNYTYDANGNLIRDSKESINNIEWNLQNKITGITKTGISQIDFAYDANGNRLYKKFSSGSITSETYYVRDALGNSLATYEFQNDTLRWQEQNIYGNNRLGVWHPNLIINQINQNLQAIPDTIDWQNIRHLPIPYLRDSTIRGTKQYELTNHIGNVIATISDRRLIASPVINGTSGITADLLTATDYYAFGMEMPGRNFNGRAYRYGYNGKENENDVTGEGNQQDYGFRIYDTRLGRFLSTDPIEKEYSFLTPYQFASNMPTLASDIDGLQAKRSKGPKTDRGYLVDLCPNFVSKAIPSISIHFPRLFYKVVTTLEIKAPLQFNSPALAGGVPEYSRRFVSKQGGMTINFNAFTLADNLLVIDNNTGNQVFSPNLTGVNIFNYPVGDYTVTVNPGNGAQSTVWTLSLSERSQTIIKTKTYLLLGLIPVKKNTKTEFRDLTNNTAFPARITTDKSGRIFNIRAGRTAWRKENKYFKKVTRENASGKRQWVKF